MQKEGNDSFAYLIDKSCLFVNHLDRSTTEEELTSYFQSFGPIKRSVIVNDAVSGQCRGYGFVKFQRAEDAAKVLELGQRLAFGSQRIFVDYALKRSKLNKSSQQQQQQQEEEEEEETPWVAPKSSKLVGLGKGTSVKQLLNSPYKTTNEDIMKRTILIRPVNQVSSQLHELLYALDGFHIYTGPIREILHCVFFSSDAAKRHISYLQQTCQRWESDMDVAFAHVPNTKRCKVVVRNLPFATTEIELINLFSKSGPVKRVRLISSPRHPNTCLGYGFVEYFLPKDAASAIRDLNGLEWNGRTMAVDYAISKNKYLQEKQNIALNNHLKSTQKGYQDENRMEQSSSTKEEDTDKRTVLIRNLPIGVDESQLESCFQVFGEIEKCWIAKDDHNGLHNGLAHVCFMREYSVKKCLKKANESLEEWEDPVLQKKMKNSVLAREVSSGGIRLDGRRLIVTRVDTQQQNKLSEQSKHNAEARNLHLLSEGYIDPQSKIAKMYSQTELEKRLALYEFRKQKVQRNPNIQVSSTRLCIRQLPRAMTEKELRKLIHLIVKEEIVNNNMNISSRRVLKNAFILRDSNRKLKDGSFRSTCRGFVQLLDPFLARKCLQRLNRDSEILGTFHEDWKGRRLIVEFALEDKRKLLALEKKKNKVQMKKDNDTQQRNPSKGKSTIPPTRSNPKSFYRRRKKRKLAE